MDTHSGKQKIVEYVFRRLEEKVYALHISERAGHGYSYKK